MNLYLDTETTGIPEKGFNWDINFKRYPYIVSIAWEFNSKVKSFIIHQEGRSIPPEATKVHGITSRMANNIDSTEPASFVYSMLMEDAKKAANIIGHNIYFDTSIIKACILKLYGVDSEQAKYVGYGEADKHLDVFHKDKRIDTMRNSQRLFGKWPKLAELHNYLFPGVEFDAHSAKEDMLACKRCYIELKKRKIL
jgi:DNA polymerase-3 subunit epsilon